MIISIIVSVIIFLTAFMLGEFYYFWKINYKDKNQCNGCKYYHKENNTCQKKKCSTNNPYVSKSDRRYCESREEEDNKNEEKV